MKHPNGPYTTATSHTSTLLGRMFTKPKVNIYCDGKLMKQCDGQLAEVAPIIVDLMNMSYVMGYDQSRIDTMMNQYDEPSC